MANTRQWGWLLLSVVLLALLGWLATLQYRGIASISEAERLRLRTSAQTRAAEMAHAFDAEIERAYFAFYQLPRPGQQPQQIDPGVAAGHHYAQWRATARYPRLIRDVLLLTLRPTGPEVRRVIPGGATEPAEWPPEFAACIPMENGKVAFGNSTLSGFIVANIPAFVVPVTNVSVSPPAGAKMPMSGSFSFSGFLFGWLDRASLEGELLPAMVRQYFSGRDGFDYHVAVVSPKEKNRFVYVSDKSVKRDVFRTPDVQTTLFQVRLEQLMAAAAGKAGASQMAFRSNPDAGEWQLRLVHRAGSLDKAVATVRRRNLAVSFGAMLLVAASTVFLVISTRRSQRLARQQMVFVAGVSHELRTPLTVIRSAGENLADGVIADPGQVQHYGAVIAEEGQRLTEMVEQVMAFAGFESGRDLSERTSVAVHDLIEDAAARSRIEEAGCTLERNVAADLPMVRVNVAALTQALENLLTNAAKYGGSDRWARVAAARSMDGRELRISVSDHGQGVRPDEHRRIFEPFYRSRDVVATTIRGSGLGLSLAKRIVEAHGGTITVRSSRDQGSTFTVHLPVDVFESPAAPASSGHAS